MARAVLVTRAEPGASETADWLAQRGCEPIVCPLLRVEPLMPPPRFNLDPGDDLIFTSANGVRAFTETYVGRTHRAYCVGPTTTAAALDAGFSNAINADGDSDSLFDLIVQQTTETSSRLVHVANRDAAGNLVARLTDAAQNAVFVPLYETVPAETFSPSAKLMLAAAKEDDVVLFHSAKAANIFCKLMNTGMDLDQMTRLTAIAISPKAGAPLSSLPFREILTASRPNEDHLVQCFDRFLARTR